MSDSKAPQGTGGNTSSTTEKPKEEGTSQLVAPPANVPRLVKIRALMPIKVSTEPNVVTPGTIVEVTEADAKEFCDRIFTGGFELPGMMPDATAERTRSRVKRAERVA